ncbi:MAG: hypothetical protein Q8882_05025 [Bacillota bacterium]|nr:hypothetical protein [Bacillota bacterium]
MSIWLEAAMVICFGISWPTSIMKSLKSKTSKGKSLLFMILIIIGYLFGAAAKVVIWVQPDKSFKDVWVLPFYILNLLMVGFDVCLYIRNKSYDKQKEAAITK